MVKNKYNTTFIQFLLICYIFKRWGNIIYIYIYIYIYNTKKTMLILNMFIYKLFYEQKKIS